jgi:AbrB family looped-hinge helix DNA binding protein
VTKAATIRDKGQLTIPAEIRRRANLSDGSIVDVELVSEGILLRPRLLVDEDTAIDAAFARDVMEQTVAGYAALRDDEGVWKEELQERDVLAGSLGDGLEGE